MADFIPHEAPADEVRGLPVMIPPKLVGRDQPLAAIYSHLKENKAVLVHGASGVGKTALAATLASAYTQQPGGVLWLQGHGDSLDALVVRIGRAFQDEDVTNTETPGAMIGAVTSVLAQSKPLIVLDGDYDAQTLLNFVSKCADGLPVLLTAEEAIDGPWENIELEALDAAAATMLFSLLGGLGDAGVTDASVKDLVETVEMLPLAIAVSARAMRAN
ncbi:MAG TPA: AAA family ATPase, partial [Verrucomicrobiae bacterium]|nr:AAA family ATPase [Verrucomicrobiae bacterium]